MKKPNILILTSIFPYLPGEFFFEDEIPYWESTELFDEITIMPWSSEGPSRRVSDRIKVEATSPATPSRLVRCLHCAMSVFYPFFYRELLYLVRSRKLTAANLRSMVACSGGTILSYRRLKRFMRGKSGYTVYAYWNSVQAYGAALARRSGLIDALVSRAHRFDVYENRRPDNYMPLKRQFAECFDRIFTLSEEGAGYMERTYGIPRHLLSVSPLGVPLPQGLSPAGGPGKMNIVSVSFCRPVKRLDKIIDAVALFAGRNPGLRVNWQHIGGGELLEEVKEYARLRLGHLENVAFSFHGTIPNSEVKGFYLRNSADIFINASESEGIPVSIMEAMAAGVPAMAPDVGGTADLVSNEHGALMSDDPSVEEIAGVIGELADRARLPETRKRARERVASRFNSAVNYPEFIERLHALATRETRNPNMRPDYVSICSRKLDCE